MFSVHRFKGSNLIVRLCVAINAGWWISRGFGVQLHGFAKRSVFDLFIELYTGRHSLVRISQVHRLESLSVRHVFYISI